MSVNSLTRVALLLLVTFLAIPAHASEDAVALDAVEVAPRVLVYRPDAPIGNPTVIAILGDDETVLLDSGIPVIAEAIDADLRSRGAKPVGRVITTHAHRDHVDGVPFWVGKGARLVTTAQQKTAMAKSPVIAEALSADLDLSATVLVTDSLRVEVIVDGRALPVRLIRPPRRDGHTDGDLLVHLPTHDVLYVGDYFFFTRFPIIDVDGGGDIEGYLSNLDWIASTFPARTRVLPGHNAFKPAPVALPDVASFRAWSQKIGESIDLIREAKSSGRSLEETIEAGLPEAFAGLSEKPRYVSEKRWIEAIWR